MSDYGMSERPLSAEIVRLERLKFVLQQHVSASVAQSAKIEELRDSIIGGLVYRVQGYVLAERLPPVTSDASIKVPATWFQHWRWNHRESRDPILRWTVRHWPIRMRTEHLSIDLQRYRSYPKANIVMPDTYGSPVLVHTLDQRLWCE